MLELLVVIAIIGILAAIALPNLQNFKPNTMAAGSRQMLDDLARARQLAISQRTTVFMVFVPTNFWNTTVYNNLAPVDKARWDRLLDKQMIAYNFVTLRSIGDQPGRWTARYLSQWRTLPDGVFIAPQKFAPRPPWKSPVPVLTIYTNDVQTGTQGLLAYEVHGFRTNNIFPFPSANDVRPNITLPFIAFNYLGQLVDINGQPTQEDELIPLGLGGVSFSRDQSTKIARPFPPSINETPVGNVTNAYNLVSVDWLTGRARIERMGVR